MKRIEIKSTLATDDSGNITGTAWPFGSADRVGDIIEKGSFAGTSVPLPMLFSHNPDRPVGVWHSVKETDAGLEVEGELLIDDVPLAKEARALVRSGAMRGLSIGFQAKKATSRKGGGRTITALDLVEISLVTIPCHPGAQITGSKTAAQAIAIAAAINSARRAISQKD